MLTVAWWICLVGLVLSVILDLTHKQVSNFLAPKKDSFFAIPRTLLSVLWLMVVPIVARVLELCFILWAIFLWVYQP